VEANVGVSAIDAKRKLMFSSIDNVEKRAGGGQFFNFNLF
jgi:hypothetical protein